jgi:purine-binding chemotaxis protein CheW
MKSEAQQTDHAALLAARAARLARPLVEASFTETMEVMTFDLGGESYAVATDQLREVFAAREVTPLPCTPAWVSGILNLRGRILTVLDLARLIGLEPLAEPETLLVLEGRQGEVALLAGEVTGVSKLPPSSFEPSNAVSNAKYVRGVTNNGLALLDVRQLLNDERLIVLG